MSRRCLATLRPPLPQRIFALGFALGALAWPGELDAQVSEPNGVVVPGEPDHEEETPLWTFFEEQGESIDAVATASVDPGTFSPRCDFEATLVLSESQASAGLAWYNVPADASAAPDAIYELLAPTTVTGTVINSADIITSPNYAGGLIGFALTKYTDSTATTTYAIYYSEYQRNVLCSACTAPDHWKMMLVYGSTTLANTFYLAFEDWEGANEQEWFGNDGDFNDKVFRVTGVSCLGGGEPCDTGKLGHCALGLTECQPGGTLGCHQQISETPEVCDNVDNDCDGSVDNEAPCPPGEVCREGNCQPPCGGGEFRCPDALYCTAAGLCLERSCVDVSCGAGEVCHGGACVGACDDVVCPLGQTCQLGRCVDPCASITCEGSTVCDRGVCVEPCNCRPCAAGLSCATSGRCVEPGCETVVCDSGSVCSQGACVDACQDAICPGDKSCSLGQCEEPLGAGGAPATSGADGGVVVGGLGGTFALPETTASATGSADSGSESSSDGPAPGMTGGRVPDEEGGCACRLTDRTSSSLPWFAPAALLISSSVRRRARLPRKRV